MSIQYCRYLARLVAGIDMANELVGQQHMNSESLYYHAVAVIDALPIQKEMQVKQSTCKASCKRDRQCKSRKA